MRISLYLSNYAFNYNEMILKTIMSIIILLFYNVIVIIFSPFNLYLNNKNEKINLFFANIVAVLNNLFW